jgi:AraC-like DNA-binding protein
VPIVVGPPPASCSVLEVRDPRELAADSLISQRLDPRERGITYRLRDRAIWRSGVGPVLTRLARCNLDSTIKVAWNRDRFGTEVEVSGAGLPRHCLSIMIEGSAAVTVRGTTTVLAGGRGAIFPGEAGKRLVTSDRSLRFNFWIEDGPLLRMLQALTQEVPRRALVFDSALDWTSEQGGPLLRLMQHLVAELQVPRGMTTNPVAMAAFTDLVVDAMLRRLPHSYTAALERPERIAVPAHLRRAEAFMAAAADRPVRLEDVAAAAGCSLRSLHLAFRRFRETTPHAALQAMRLDRVRAALIAEREAPVAVIARRFGFTHATRFAVAYAGRFAELPAQTQRRGVRVSRGVSGR